MHLVYISINEKDRAESVRARLNVCVPFSENFAPSAPTKIGFGSRETFLCGGVPNGMVDVARDGFSV
jgi:hypothetical protein